MRRFVVLVIALCAVPAADAAACERRPGTEARFVLTKADDGRLVACDRRTGKRRLLATGRRRVYAHGLAGAEARWVELRRNEPTFGTLVRVRLPRGTQRRQGLGHLDARRIENGGRTVRWDDDGTIRWVDVATPLVRDGCPARDSFRRVAVFDDVVVTKADHAHRDFAADETWRVCVRGTGRDPIFTRVRGQERLRPLGLDRGTLVVERGLVDKAMTGGGPSGERYDVTTGKRLRWFPWP
jgi:hypothetical protein